MANNNFGPIAIEVYRKGETNFAVIGTDGVFHVDARLSHESAVERIAEFAAEFIKRNAHFEWRGDVYLLGGRGRTLNLFGK